MRVNLIPDPLRDVHFAAIDDPFVDDDTVTHQMIAQWLSPQDVKS